MEESGNLPIDIANIVFNEEPPAEKSVQLYCHTDNNDKVTSLEIFEIFLTILTEGIFIKYKPVTEETFKMFSEETLTNLQPWLRGLGFDVIVKAFPSTCDIQEQKEFKNYYCKVIMKCDSSWTQYFEIHNVEKDYHFILGSNSPYIKGKNCTLDNLFCVFVINDMTYKISFKCI